MEDKLYTLEELQDNLDIGMNFHMAFQKADAIIWYFNQAERLPLQDRYKAIAYYNKKITEPVKKRIRDALEKELS